MRWPRVRFTIRRMMLAVAVVALLLGVVALLRRRGRFQELAAGHARTARRFLGGHFYITRPGIGLVHTTWPPRTPLVDHHESLAKKYEQAARHPWLPIPPDPPPPK